MVVTRTTSVNVFNGKVKVPVPVAVAEAFPVNVPEMIPPIVIEPVGIDAVVEFNANG